MLYPGTLLYRVYDDVLSCCGANEYTQFGEDGLIQAVLDRIGVKHKWCFEVGAADGLFYSNTLRLREQGWKAVLVEGDPGQYQELELDYASEDVYCCHEYTRDMDAVLRRCGAPQDLDLGVIDIDGQDYWLWHDMVEYVPRVMLVEFHSRKGEEFIPPRDPEDTRQAGRLAVMRLGEQKGYKPVAETHVNLLFVREELWSS